METIPAGEVSPAGVVKPAGVVTPAEMITLCILIAIGHRIENTDSMEDGMLDKKKINPVSKVI